MESKPFYESTTIQGAIISVAVFLFQIFKIEVGSELVTSFVVGVFGVIGTGMVIYGRIKAKKGINL